MSAYENYTAISADYDRTRIPVGVEIILGCLASGGRSLGSLRLLDAGCGDHQYVLPRATPPQLVARGTGSGRGRETMRRRHADTEVLAGLLAEAGLAP